MTQKTDNSRPPADKRRKTPRPKHPKVTPVRPGYACYPHPVQIDGGQILKEGLYWHGVRDATSTDTFICSPLEVVAITRDEHGENYGRLLRFMTLDGEWREWAAPMEMLSGDGSDLRAELLRMGVTIPHRQRQALTDYIMDSRPPRRVLAATATGWHSPALFVMPGRIIGDGDVVFQSTEASSREYATAGTLTQWQGDVAARCAGNPVPMMAVCAALAGPLLHLLDVDSGGFHFMGDSSSGKSVAALVACSVWGEPRSFKRNWNATSTGLEGLATMRNDTVLILDEIGEAPAREIGGLIYQLGNGTGRQRGKVNGMARPVNTWRTMLISTGELTVGKYMESGGQPAKAGQEMRLSDVPAQRRYGVFDDLHGMARPHNPDNAAECRGAGRAFVEALRTNAYAYYGHAGPTFVAFLIALHQQDADSAQLMERFRQLREQFPVSTGQESRVAARFALCALAGELAITAGILPWKQGAALEAVKAMFVAWADYRGRGQSEDRKILRAVSDFITRHSARFEPFASQCNTIANRAGWFRVANGKNQYLLTGQALDEATPGYDTRRVASCLGAAGVLAERDCDTRHTKRVSIGGEKHRVYVIDQIALSFVNDE
ncbi:MULTISPECIES: DUF927 domain-containing protein [unclassified Brenneria]|uniref:DUF927 domain-containing protein n=1 Tax=unclassified Brenneria TaxID=2634434 RepID=UPI0029C2EFEF|nr:MULTISPECIES: DUF927 domain-containing protein [unclassified Brenneria]MDX5627314.1 DUF927 domain-containing protein [Brenneria sp. L3-3Z]MDX5694530.1 DUF927 domain-containing protein [Brenneria sp. L4-2C]